MAHFFGPSGVDFYSSSSQKVFAFPPSFYTQKAGGLLFGPFLEGSGGGFLFGHGTNKGVDFFWGRFSAKDSGIMHILLGFFDFNQKFRPDVLASE